ncbi:MAG: aldolase [Verrucomicrobiales bacterium]|nr:aldolase [Verrucomicrobiales bacterium]|tara:strand:- start:5136 stop:6053 length:918 start_codon:yes stop_codon:yes gene_type:complete
MKTLTQLLLLAFALQLPAQDKPARINKYIQLMEQGKPAFGVFSSKISVRNGANMASSGLDFVIVDLEHTPYDLTKLEGYLLGMINKRDVLKNGLQQRTAPFIRVPGNGREQLQFILKQVLDLGPVGLVVPHIDTAEDARAMVAAARFPQLKDAPDFEPQGKRGVGYGWAARYWGLSGTEYARRADVWPLDPQGEIALWLMIETKASIKNIREIAAVPGIGGLFIGPSDLAFSLGVPLGDPAVEVAMQNVVKAAKEANVPLGTLCGGSQVEMRLSQGFRFLAVGSDSGPGGNVRDAVKTGRVFKAK